MENKSFKYFSNSYVGKVPKNEKKNESFRYISNGYVWKVTKNEIIKVLGTFLMGTLEKYLKIEK